MRRKLLLVLLFPSLALALAACDDEVQPGPEPGPEPVEGYVELGFFDDAVYTPLRDGDPIPVVNGIQGGTWTMPAVRVSGIKSFVDITCEMHTSTGERVSLVSSKAKLFAADDGMFEARMFPIPVHHEQSEGAPIDDLYGMDATLDCTVTDSDGNWADCSLDLVIANGDL